MIEQAPVQIGFSNRSQAPRVNGNGTTKTVVHRELISVLAGTANFFVLESQLNPGLYVSFPWLSSEALTYEMYKWNFLRFVYEPSTGTNITGTVMMAIDFDCSDTTPLSENELMNHCDAVAGPSWASLTYETQIINFNRQFPNKFVRTGGISNDTDIHSYDLGNLMIATAGQPNTNIIGRIYAEYSVTFMIPSLPTQGERGDFGYAEYNASLSGTSAYFGTSAFPSYSSGSVAFIPGPFGASDCILYIEQFAPGTKFMFEWRVDGTGIATLPTVAATGSSATLLSTFNSWSIINAGINLLYRSFWTANSYMVSLRFTGTTFTSVTKNSTMVAILPPNFSPALLSETQEDQKDMEPRTDLEVSEDWEVIKRKYLTQKSEKRLSS
jgi:hypothetical protein